jgi:hypothetical protein
MRAGLAFSVLGHIGLLVWGFVLFASPKLFAPIPPDAIVVDIVPAAAMAQDLRQAPPASPSAPQSAASDRQQQPAQDSSYTSGIRTARGQAAPERRSSVREPAEAPPQDEPPSNLLVFNPTVAPVREVPLPTGGVQNPAGGFDAPADAAAKLSREEIAALRAHLQRCWNPPAAVAEAQKLKVVLRIALAPNGALTEAPSLVEASASAQGPALVAAAMSALRKCQPYSFLPAAKYEEWKLLDLSFSPRGLLGG